MTDPVLTPDPAVARGRLNKVFLFAALSDILTGLVCAVIGYTQEIEVLTIVGVALALCGTGVLAWVIVRTSRPEQL